MFDESRRSETDEREPVAFEEAVPHAPVAEESAREAQDEEAARDAAAPAAPARKGRRRAILAIVLLAALAGGSWYGWHWWTDGRFMVSTDDAYLSADMAILTPKITGYVAEVPVHENQAVRKGDPIVVIDPGDYELALRSAEAKLETQRAAIERIAAQRAAAVESIAQAEANGRSATAALEQATLTLGRAEELSTSGAGTRAALDAARSQESQARAAVAGAEAAVAAANAQVGVLDAQRKEAESTLAELQVARDVAARDLGFATLRAPYDGIVGNMSVEVGDLVSPSRRLAAVVPLDQVFVEANFKETQTGEVAPGQSVRIEVDALPGHEFTGHVASLSPASGSVFSLLPADNATGNFTKIVQRVPVRIEIDPDQPGAEALRAGLSVTASVDSRTTPQGEGAIREAHAR